MRQIQQCDLANFAYEWDASVPDVPMSLSNRENAQNSNRNRNVYPLVLNVQQSINVDVRLPLSVAVIL